MKQQVFYIHGGEAYSDYENFLNNLKTKEISDPYGLPKKRWANTLREELGAEYEVFTPTMPNKQNAKYTEWKIWFERHFPFLADGVILLGWSQGAYFLAKYLSENTMPVQVKALILAAAPFEPADFGGEDGGDFAFAADKVGEIVRQIPKIYLLHSEDDFVVPYEHALKYKAVLPEAKLITFTDKNHFLVEELPELVEMIKELG